MSKLLRYVAIYLLLGMAYSFFLNEEAGHALKAEEQRAIQKRSAAYSYTAKKREEHPNYSSAELKTKANIFFVVFVCSSVMFVLFGSCALDTTSR